LKGPQTEAGTFWKGRSKETGDRKKKKRRKKKLTSQKGKIELSSAWQGVTTNQEHVAARRGEGGDIRRAV